MVDIKSYVKAYIKEQKQYVDQALQEYLDELPYDSQLTKAMAYALMAGGKRLRPILCISAAKAIGANEKDVMPAACAIEMIHTYSLIHDDLPAMDDDDMRRGQPTCHKQFDEATAILAGDALLTHAFYILSNTLLKSNDPLTWAKIIHILTQACGCQGMIEGQMRDMIAEKQSLTLDELETLHQLKTGALIQVSITIGALLGNATSWQLDQLAIYGQALGIAFQIVDDILNVTGDSSIMGKSVGTDFNRQKSTYPSLLGLDQSKQKANDLSQRAIKALAQFDNCADPLRTIAKYVVERNR